MMLLSIILKLNIDSNYLMAYQRVTQLLLGKNRTLEAICYIDRELTIDLDNFYLLGNKSLRFFPMYIKVTLFLS